MWQDHSYNNEEYYRDDRERERTQWWNQAPMEPYYQPPPYSQHREDEGYEWNNQERYEPSDEEMSYGWNHDYQYEPTEYGWNPHYQQEPFGPNCHDSGTGSHQDDEIKSMLRQLLDGQRSNEEEISSLNAKFEGTMTHVRRLGNQIALHLNSFDEDDVEEVSKDEEMTPEGEVMDFPATYYEIVVKHEEDHIYTQQQSPAGEEVEEFIQLQDALDEDALASIVAVMNEKSLRYNNASTNKTNKEEEEVVQLFELPQKELHSDEVVEPRVPGTPTPRRQQPQSPRKRLEWRIKHKWKEKPHNV